MTDTAMPIVEDLDLFFADFGVACSSGGRSFIGLMDMPTNVIGAGMPVLSNEYLLALKTSDATGAGLAQGSAVTVAGTAYSVREVLLMDDGAISTVTLTRT